MTQAMPKSYIKLYWRIWLMIIACLLILRVYFIEEDFAYTLFNFYMIPTWIAIMVLNIIEGYKLRTYLEENHHQTWEKITNVPGFGSGGYNGFRALPFIYSDDNLSDPILKELKLNYKRFIKLILTVFFTMPLLFTVIVMLP
ncbi:hypothetical protein PGH07_06495 [Sulfurovum sp. zt1-1]|uniref:Uncharacterized protein n=1 Tax=Sulfurovum zhangzhouensis TaxID=3019067 RepID=A0ABT7QYA9_9BACT|nr:hypothetical protein [Sulfurovum zhangzhouensis]MDM5271820.1 hypothetical protein [Sulfurovum zhangzhouensis]